MGNASYEFGAAIGAFTMLAVGYVLVGMGRERRQRRRPNNGDTLLAIGVVFLALGSISVALQLVA